MAGKEKNLPLLPRVTGGTVIVLPVPAWPWRGQEAGEEVREWKSRAQGGSGYLRSGLVSVSGVLVLGVLTLDCRIKVNSVSRTRVNPGKSDARFQTSVHHDSEKGDSKRRNAIVQ